jgi:iron complex transport system permease protein
VSRDLVIRVSRLGLSVRAPRRATTATVLLTLALVVAICLMTAYAEDPISVGSVLRGVLGQGNALNQLVVRQFRLPRIIEGALVGCALGLSGAIFQSLTRNPLATPDLMGINQGAAVVAVWMILDGYPTDVVPFGALIGALAATALVGLLAIRRRFSMYRLLLIGIGVNAFATAVVAYLLTRATYQQSTLEYAQQWLLGSLYFASWHSIRTVALAIIVLTPLAIGLGQRLNVFQLGDDLAAGLGVSTTRFQVTLAALGALLAAAAVSVAGPIGFVAFLSPHIARRVAHTSSAASLPVAMGVGALLVTIADYAAREILAPTELPVGILTVLLGSPYLLFLLYRGERNPGIGH